MEIRYSIRRDSPFHPQSFFLHRIFGKYIHAYVTEKKQEKKAEQIISALLQIVRVNLTLHVLNAHTHASICLLKPSKIH